MNIEQRPTFVTRQGCRVETIRTRRFDGGYSEEIILSAAPQPFRPPKR